MSFRLRGAMMEDVPRIFDAVFECTLAMITKNFEDYPEHRLKFFSLLRAIASHCFRSLFVLPPQVGWGGAGARGDGRAGMGAGRQAQGQGQGHSERFTPLC